jgi:hypothetical protein
MEFRLGSEQRVCSQGDVVVIPGGAEHEAWFLEDTEVIDFFAPPREDFLLGGKPTYMSEGWTTSTSGTVSRLATTSMPQQLLFELNGARVTPHIATFGGTSYQIANIGSVHIVRRRKYNPFAIIIFLLGLGILAAAIVKSRMTGLAEEYFSMAATAVAVMVASLLLQLILPRRVYVLVLRTSGGDVDAVISRNKEFVSNVQKAVEQAFVVRARQPPVNESWGQ